MSDAVAKPDAAPGWSMGLAGWRAQVGQMSAVTLVCTLFAWGGHAVLSDYFDQAREDRLLCRQQITAVRDAIEKQVEQSRRHGDQMETLIREVRHAIDRRPEDKK